MYVNKIYRVGSDKYYKRGKNKVLWEFRGERDYMKSR